MSEVAVSATDATRRVVQMVDRDRQGIHGMGRGAPTTLRVHEYATRRIVLRAGAVAEDLQLSAPPVYAAIAHLEDAGILREVTGRRRGKLYVYDEYLELLNEDTGAPLR